MGSAANPVLRKGNSDRHVAPPEQSVSVKDDISVAIEMETASGETKILKDDIPLLAGEVIDASFMDVKELCEFYEKEISEASEAENLLSLHLKATMMKVSDPVMFGHAIMLLQRCLGQAWGQTGRAGCQPQPRFGSYL